MCGRFTRTYSWREVHDFLDLRLPGPEEMLPASYNVAPTQRSAVCRVDGKGKREIVVMKWGLVPSWSKDPAKGFINARSEGVAEKPAFRAAFKRRRCLVPVSAFYEWQAIPGEKRKQPWCFTPADEAIMVFAGLWEQWGEKDEGFESFTILTTAANALLARVHDRMPVVLARGDVDEWLTGAPETAAALMRPCPAKRLRAHPVSTRVNSPANNDASLIEPVEAGA